MLAAGEVAELDVQIPRRIEQKQVAYLRDTAHVAAQQFCEHRPGRRGTGRVRIEEFRLPQDEIRRLQGTGGLFGQSSGNVIVLALRIRQRGGTVAQGVEQRRQPHGGAHRDDDQYQPQAQRPTAGAVAPAAGT